MLAPDGRALLLDGLRPPPGMTVDRAVATTFTLELTTALTVPLALVGYSLTDTPDPIRMMEAVRTTANRLDVFCQAGAISAPGWPSDLVVLLEEVVHEARRPRPGHLFHPKVWVLRYADNGGVRAFRCLVLSRNLTADRSWDLVLRLDSNPDTTRINQDNDGLVRFVKALPGLAATPLAENRAAAVAELADDLRRVWWELPEGADRIVFWPFGLPGARRPKTDQVFGGNRHLIISPFVTADGIAIVTAGSAPGRVSVVARAEELDRLPTGTLDGVAAFAINPLAGLDEPDQNSAADTVDPGRLFGALHAKLYIVEANRRARVLIGSANATAAAFGGNIELLCEIAGGYTKLGIDAMLGEDAPFRSLLEEYLPPDIPVSDADADAARAVEAYLVDIAQAGFSVHVAPMSGAWQPTITSNRSLPDLPKNATIAVTVAPYNRPAETTGAQPGATFAAVLQPRPSVEVTPFLVISGSSTTKGAKAERRILVCAALIDAPPGRADEILIRQIDTPEKFFQLLALLLGFGAAPTPPPGGTADGGAGSWAAMSATGIFELLVRGLAAQPEGIDRLAAIIDGLRASDLAAKILPAGWDDLWAAVNGARQLIGREHR
ncbi:MAG: phospholipase D family protein [Actinomycetota bacterium]|nr:phospholipase D family protein [Actinomycetota bacterium]